MRILLLTQIVPYPPDAGPRVKTWHVLRYLAERGHQVTLVSFVREEELGYLAELDQVAFEVHTVPLKRSRAKDAFYLMSSMIAGRSFLMERDHAKGMQALVSNLVASGNYDVVIADQLPMTQFLLGLDRPGLPKRIFDAHNAVYTIVDRMMKEAAPAVLQPVLRRETERVKRFEGRVVREFEATLAVTDVDREHLARAARDAGSESQMDWSQKITVIPIAVDTQRIRPVQRRAGGKNILTLGTLHYPPNADGIRWFLREVFPRITDQDPEVCLTIVGKNPPADFIQMAAQNPRRIEVTGYVPDLNPYFQAADVMVIPVRAGSGMRVRILEAFAAGMPVVTTTVGIEGIRAKPGEEVLIADTPEDFADSVLRLMKDFRLADRLAKNSRGLAESEYDWRATLRQLDQVLTGS